MPDGLTGVVAVAAGGSFGAGGGHSLALKADGTVVAWGGGEGPSTVPELQGAVALAGKRDHILALKADGTVVAWRWDSGPAGLNGVVALAAGDTHSLALKSDGTVVAWGQIHNGSAWVPVTVPDGLTGVVALAAGTYHSLALVAYPPALAVQASGDSVSLSWPLWAQGFALQATPNLAEESSWTPVLTMPVVEGSQNRVTDLIAGPAKFYRLMRP